MTTQINNFAMFVLNYPANFIQDAFPCADISVYHLESKFSAYYTSYGCRTAMLMFYVNLSTHNQLILENFINAYYAKKEG